MNNTLIKRLIYPMLLVSWSAFASAETHVELGNVVAISAGDGVISSMQFGVIDGPESDASEPEQKPTRTGQPEDVLCLELPGIQIRINC